jgi:hypothetical protein
MKDRDSSIDRPRAAELSGVRRDAGSVLPGRLGTFALLGAAAGSVPLPWLPDLALRRVRGALAHDVLARRGLSLTPEARAIFAEPAGVEGPRGFAREAMKFVSQKVLVRFGPLAMFPTFRAGLYTYVLGHLLARYLDTARRDRSIRVDVNEARDVRRAIDRAILHTITGELDPERPGGNEAPEDLRDDMTQIVDGLLIATAGVPAWLVNRLEAAFDDVIAHQG